jgi:hypothetical protein
MMDEDNDIEIPGDGDENVGDGSVARKKVKKRKSKEERVAERKVVFWTFVIVLVATLGFWIVPKIGDLLRNGWKRNEPSRVIMDSSINNNDVSVEKESGRKNYIEIVL